MSSRILICLVALLALIEAAPIGPRIGRGPTGDYAYIHRPQDWHHPPFPQGDDEPILQGLHPWGTTFTTTGNITSADIGINLPQSVPAPFSLINDLVNQVWNFTSPGDNQIATKYTSCIVQGGFGFLVAGHNYSQQFRGYSYLFNAAPPSMDPILFGPAFDIASNGNMISNVFQLVTLQEPRRCRGKRATKVWGFGQPFDKTYLAPGATGVGGVLTGFDSTCDGIEYPEKALDLFPECYPTNPHFVPIAYQYAFPTIGFPQTAVYIPTI